MGSRESFRRFPLDLIEYIKAQGGIAAPTNPFSSFLTSATSNESASESPFDYDTYDYATSGDNDARVSELVDWLRIRCSEKKPSYLVLLAHSMGGLMAADAASLLLAGFSADIEPEVNIRAVLAFDSPFFGLHPHVITQSGVQKVSKTVEQVSNVWTALAGATGTGAATSAAASRSGSSSTVAASGSKSSSGSLWGLAAFAAVAAVGVAAASHPVVQTQIQRTTEMVTKHAEFLGPLWKVEGQEARVAAVRSLEKRLVFKCFYLQTPTTEPPATFINLPSSLDPATRSHFVGIKVPRDAVPKIAHDEIDAHVNMFDAMMGTAYFEMMGKVVEVLKGIESKSKC
ncbi:hypothetical protein HDU96_008018 [Phlyctochytrium bullatum]|nr:hypothetical protein HDU96_008018 [Phlyctochytrium bullatum]